jgi:hypothetical protein
MPRLSQSSGWGVVVESAAPDPHGGSMNPMNTKSPTVTGGKLVPGCGAVGCVHVPLPVRK